MLLAMLGGSEIAIILVIVLLIFGPTKLPQLGSSIGKMLRGFKKEMRAIEEDDDETKQRAELDVTPVDDAADDGHARAPSSTPTSKPS